MHWSIGFAELLLPVMFGLFAVGLRVRRHRFASMAGMFFLGSIAAVALSPADVLSALVLTTVLVTFFWCGAWHARRQLRLPNTP
ncbi:hypothetical protein LOC71_02485 [Rhodopirellula sp. JC740]|uniref:Uncharacterized protein n=1 Tax=Rhodopirellula halodulae TaxID=2894198 RepID=A0ABS8NCK0_9BACT|nr:hypothetical protein [Rhodopirellula sp. JC740]MCC9641124.1 hypothetical protein [Rhodopirellula sp. JC740]